jgi:hypothetical protein
MAKQAPEKYAKHVRSKRRSFCWTTLKIASRAALGLKRLKRKKEESFIEMFEHENS